MIDFTPWINKWSDYTGWIAKPGHENIINGTQSALLPSLIIAATVLALTAGTVIAFATTTGHKKLGTAAGTIILYVACLLILQIASINATAGQPIRLHADPAPKPPLLRPANGTRLRHLRLPLHRRMPIRRRFPRHPIGRTTNIRRVGIQTPYIA